MIRRMYCLERMYCHDLMCALLQTCVLPRCTATQLCYDYNWGMRDDYALLNYGFVPDEEHPPRLLLVRWLPPALVLCFLVSVDLFCFCSVFL